MHRDPPQRPESRPGTCALGAVTRLNTPHNLDESLLRAGQVVGIVLTAE
jgi:hypothetical protein